MQKTESTAPSGRPIEKAEVRSMRMRSRSAGGWWVRAVSSIPAE